VFLGVLWIAGLIGAARGSGHQKARREADSQLGSDHSRHEAKIVGAVGWTSAGWVVCVIVLGLIAPLYIGCTR